MLSIKNNVSIFTIIGDLKLKGIKFYQTQNELRFLHFNPAQKTTYDYIQTISNKGKSAHR